MTEEYEEGHGIPQSVVDQAKKEDELQKLIGVHYKKAFQELFPDNGVRHDGLSEDYIADKRLDYRTPVFCTADWEYFYHVV